MTTKYLTNPHAELNRRNLEHAELQDAELATIPNAPEEQVEQSAALVAERQAAFLADQEVVELTDADRALIAAAEKRAAMEQQEAKRVRAIHADMAATIADKQDRSDEAEALRAEAEACRAQVEQLQAVIEADVS